MFIKRGDNTPVTVIETEADLEKAEANGELSAIAVAQLKEEFAKQSKKVDESPKN